MNPDDWHDLIQRHMAGLTSDAEATQLQEALLRDDAVARLYLRYMHLDVALEAKAASAEATRELLTAPIPVEEIRSSRRVSWRPLAAIAAAAIVLLALLLTSKPKPERGPAPVPKLPPQSVATVLFAEGCAWEPRGDLADGQRLENGPLHLKGGLAILRFDGGAEMLFTGDTLLQLESRGSVRIDHGQITLRVGPQSTGFKVRTPTGDFTDLGSEFKVKVADHGETELHVLNGAVSYAPPGAAQRDATAPRVTAGQAVRFSPGQGTAPTAIAFHARSYAELIRAAKILPREDLLQAYEPFNYPEGKLALVDAFHGHGWAGPWQIAQRVHLPAGDDGAMKIASDRIHGPWPVRGGRATMLELGTSFGSRARKLVQPVRLDRDGITYFSMMVRWEVPAAKLTSTEPPFLRVALCSTTDGTGDRVAWILPAFLKPQVQISDGITFTSPAQVRVNEAQFWCGKIVARAQGEDEISFRIYGEGETLDFAEPATWHLTTHGIHSDAVLDLLVLAAGGSGTAWIDEVRLGANWRAVVPPEAIDH